jgi:hypothetical protein
LLGQTSGLSATDSAKIIVLLCAFAGLYGLSRWSSRITDAIPPVPEPPPEPERSSTAGSQRVWPKIVPIDSRPQFQRTTEYSESELEPIRVTNTYFRTFDYLPGPPDPATFADELFVELYNAETGHQWTVSYFVASPDGIRELLDREKWQYAHTGDVILVRRYDPKVVRQAVLEDLIESQEKQKATREEDS